MELFAVEGEEKEREEIITAEPQVFNVVIGREKGEKLQPSGGI